jgi:hypothetical protein
VCERNRATAEKQQSGEASREKIEKKNARRKKEKKKERERVVFVCVCVCEVLG